MKKLIALIACISVFACMSVSALAAAPTGSVGDISYTEATESASGYFTIDASDVAIGNTQTTIVVIDGVKTVEDGVEKYNISTDTIQYINQQDTASFTVIPKDHDTYLESATEKTLTVLIGGDNITRKELGTITYAAAAGGEDAETITISGTVSGYVGATLPTVIVTDGTTEYPASVSNDGTFTVKVPVLTTGTYTLYVTKNGYLSYTKSNISEEANAISATLKFGDIDANGEVGINDVGATILKYKVTSSDSGYDSIYDSDENGEIGINDVGTIILNYKSTSISE